MEYTNKPRSKQETLNVVQFPSPTNQENNVVIAKMNELSQSMASLTSDIKSLKIQYDNMDRQLNRLSVLGLTIAFIGGLICVMTMLSAGVGG